MASAQENNELGTFSESPLSIANNPTLIETFKSNNRKKIKRTKTGGKTFKYPLSDSPSEATGDRLIIKCLEYIAPQKQTENDKGKVTDRGTQNVVRTRGIFDSTGNLYTAEQRKKDGITPTISVDFYSADERISKRSKIKYMIELPVPQEVNDSNQVTWGEDTLNALEVAALSVAGRVLEGNFGENAVEDAQKAVAALQSGVTFGSSGLDNQITGAIRASISGAAVGALGSNVSARSILARNTGQILNSNLELLFQGVNLRSFPFSVTFTPRSEDEGEVVKNIIRNLKKSMSPKAGDMNGGSATGIFLKSPDLFQLQYMHHNGTKYEDHQFLNKFKLCALTGMSVNYSNAGTYATYSNGTPVALRLNMTFKEINPIYNEDYTDDIKGVGF